MWIRRSNIGLNDAPFIVEPREIKRIKRGESEECDHNIVDRRSSLTGIFLPTTGDRSPNECFQIPRPARRGGREGVGGERPSGHPAVGCFYKITKGVLYRKKL